MGGFRPVEPSTTTLPLLDTLPGLLEATWPKGDHGTFIQRLQQYAARAKWAQLLTALAAAGSKALAKLQPDAGGGRKRKRGDAPQRDALWCDGLMCRVMTPVKYFHAVVVSVLLSVFVCCAFPYMPVPPKAFAFGPPNTSTSTSAATHSVQWRELDARVTAAQQTVTASAGGMAFAFVEGQLSQAVQQGHWLLLDEVNLAPAEVRTHDFGCT